ncbi:hypothetical protein MMC29_004138, partial [Sticta canariensis]|nr:hypothetical protein [Sticta canariensis]
MAPSAGLVSLLADHTTPSFLLEAAVEYLESLNEKISECELVIKEGVNNDKGEGEGKADSNRHDGGDETNKRLEGGAQQQTRRKGSKGSYSKKENEAELVRLRKQRDVIVRD